MPKILTKSQSVAMRLHAADVARELAYDDQDGYEFEERSRSELNSHKKALLRASNLNGEGVDAAKSDQEVRSRADAHEAFMSLIDAIDEELDERQRGNQDRADQERRAKMRPLRDTSAFSAISSPGDDGEYADEPTQVFALRSRQNYSDFVQDRNPNAQYRSLSVGSYLRAMVTGPQTDMERRALSEGTDSAGGYTVPEVLSARLIDRMRAASVLTRAGAQTVPLTSQKNYIATLNDDPKPGWRAELGPVKVSDMSFGRVEFEARSLAVLVKVSRELLEDSLNIESILPNVLATAMAQELDRVALFGSGNAPEPKGVANFTGLTPTSYAGGVLSGYAPLIRARTALRNINSDVSAYVMSPRDEGALAELVDVSGQPLNVPQAIASVPMLTTSKVPVNLGANADESMILAGEWSKLMIGIRSNIRIEIVKEAFAETLEYGFLAHLRADVACEQEAAFTKLSATKIAA